MTRKLWLDGRDVPVVTTTTRTMLRYPGGKSRAIKVLSPLVPEGTSTVTSPFLGGGSFELHLTGRGITVDASDLFSQLVDFWTVMDKGPSLLADRLGGLLGEIDKETFVSLQKKLRTPEDIAIWFYAVNRCSFSGGHSKAAASGRFTPSSVTHRDYHDADLFFLDPPYLLGGSRESLYGDRGDMHESFDHVEFRDLVKVLGGRDNQLPEYAEMSGRRLDHEAGKINTIEGDTSMSTIEDFENAPVGATATRADGCRAMKTPAGEWCWVLSNGLYRNNGLMGDYTLDQPAPESAREALDLAWELAHEVEPGQAIPKGTRYLEFSDDVIGEHIAHIDFTVSPEAPVLRTLEPLSDPKPDWLDAPAVLAVHESHTKPSIWGKHWDQEVLSEFYQSALTAETAHWSELHDVVPLYPKEGQDA